MRQAFEDIVEGQFEYADWYRENLHETFPHIDPNSKVGKWLLEAKRAEAESAKELNDAFIDGSPDKYDIAEDANSYMYSRELFAWTLYSAIVKGVQDDTGREVTNQGTDTYTEVVRQACRTVNATIDLDNQLSVLDKIELVSTINHLGFQFVVESDLHFRDVGRQTS